MQVNSGKLTFVASAALDPYLRVSLDSSNELEAAGATTNELGTLVDRVLAADDHATIETARVGEVFLMVAAGAITQYASVYGAAAGKVDDVVNENYLGLALESASAAGSVIRVLRLRDVIDLDPLGDIDGNVLIDDDFIGDYPAAATALAVGGLTKLETDGLGVISVDEAGGRLKFSFDAVAEVGVAALYYANSPISPAEGGVAEFVLAVYDIGDDAALDIDFGLAVGHHATDFESIAEFVAFHLDGTDLSLKCHSDDGTTDTAAVDSAVDLVDNTWYAFKIDFTDLSDVKFFYRALGTTNWTALCTATTFDVSDSSGTWTPIVMVEKTSNDTTADVRLDRWRVQANRDI